MALLLRRTNDTPAQIQMPPRGSGTTLPTAPKAADTPDTELDSDEVLDPAGPGATGGETLVIYQDY